MLRIVVNVLECEDDGQGYVATLALELPSNLSHSCVRAILSLAADMLSEENDGIERQDGRIDNTEC